MHAGFVDAFEKAWTKRGMHLETRIHDLSGDILQAIRKGTAISQFFVAFVSSW